MPSRVARPLVVVIGSINTDLVCRTARIPRSGETVLGSDLSELPGGKGANQAVAAARLGARVGMVGCVGNDDAGRRLIKGLAAAGVRTRYVRRCPGVPSGCAVIVVAPGANACVSPVDVDDAVPLIRGADVVLLQLEIPLATVRHAVAVCRRLGVPAILDPAPVPEKGLPRSLYGVTILTPNEPEAALLTGQRAAGRRARLDARRAGKDLLDQGAGCVVLKLGARGSVLLRDDGTVVSAAPPRVRVVDSTAAGDAFTAALAVAIAEGRPPKLALRFANAAGALCCTKRGAQPALPERRDVDAMLKKALRRPASRAPRGRQRGPGPC